MKEKLFERSRWNLLKKQTGRMMVVSSLDARGLTTLQSVISELTKEKESTMRRLRLISLGLASSLLLTLSGCCSFCQDGQMFPRLFNRSSNRAVMASDGAACECQHQSAWSPGVPMPVGQGPFLVPSGAPHQPPPIPITNIPPAQPQLFKIPQAPPTAYHPGN